MVHAKMVAIFEMTKQSNLKDLPGKSAQRRIISHAHCFLTVCEKKLVHIMKLMQRNSEKWREAWRQVTMVAKFLDLNYCYWQRRSFALTNDRRKLWATVLFLSAIRHRKVIHINFFVFLLYWQDRDGFCWDPERLLPWQRDVTTSPLYWQMFWRHS